MTTKYLTGVHPLGYTLSAAYTGLVIEATTRVAGTGVSAGFFATIQNDGSVDATTAINYGVSLSAGGIVTNGSATDTVALIAGYYGGVDISGKLGTVVNYGTIDARGSTSYGIHLHAGGSVTNGSASDTTALIEGIGPHYCIGVVIYGGPGTVTNFGTIDTSRSSYSSTIYLSSGGNVTNGSASDTTAQILGTNNILTVGGALTLTNFGTIHSNHPNSGGVILSGGGSVTNGSAADRTAQIETQIECTGYRPARVTNFGTVFGVTFYSTNDVLLVEAQSVFQVGPKGGGGTLDLASGTGTINGLAGGNVTVSGSMAATTFTNFGTIEIAGGATFTLTGTGTIGSGGTGALIIAGALTIGGTATLNDAGVIDQTGTVILRQDAKAPRLTIANGGTYKLDGDVGIARRASDTPVIVVDGLFIKSAGTGVGAVGVVVSDAGTIEAAKGTLSFIAGVQGVGMMKIDAGATLRFANTVASTLTASFNGAGGTLALSKANVFAAVIAGFATGETIDLINTGATSAMLNGSDQLVITNGTTAVATLQLTGAYTGATFATASDGHGGTAITVSGGAALPARGFVAAMAAMSGGGAAHAPASRPEEAWRPLLASSRTAFHSAF